MLPVEVELVVLDDFGPGRVERRGSRIPCARGRVKSGWRWLVWWQI